MGYNSDGSRMDRKFPEAKIAMCKCKESKGKIYGVRFQRKGSGWEYTWAFKMNEASARREGYDKTELIGNITPTKSYPGCPYCGNRYFVICGDCHKLNCKITTGDTFTCDWCGNTGTLEDYDGDGISAGGDRG